MEELNVWYEKLQKMIEKHNKEREETYIKERVKNCIMVYVTCSGELGSAKVD